MQRQITDNLAKVQRRIANAARQAGRSPEEITLIGVTKYVGTAETAALLAAGCKNLGESRPQALWEKAAEPSLAGAKWHLIGHLQRNKVAKTLPLSTLIHSVDSERLLTAIDKAAAAANLRSNVLLEFNMSGESAKHGFPPKAARDILAKLSTWKHVRVQGFMTMAHRRGGKDTARENFAALRTMQADLAATTSPPLTKLSMGMSGDFEEAILEGATLVRVGSALFEGIPRR